MKTCQCCPRCEPSLLHDRIILRILSNNIKEDLHAEGETPSPRSVYRHLQSQYETAVSHSDALVPDNVNRVLYGKQRNDTKECKFCSFNHPMKKVKCLAWGKVCNKGGKIYHFGLTRWTNRPPLTTVTESDATTSPHLTRNQ